MTFVGPYSVRITLNSYNQNLGNKETVTLFVGEKISKCLQTTYTGYSRHKATWSREWAWPTIPDHTWRTSKCSNKATSNTRRMGRMYKACNQPSCPAFDPATDYVQDGGAWVAYVHSCAESQFRWKSWVPGLRTLHRLCGNLSFGITWF